MLSLILYYRKAIALMSVKDNIITVQKKIPTSFLCHSISFLEADRFLVGTYESRQPICIIDFEGAVQHKVLPDLTSEGGKSACTYITTAKISVSSNTEQDSVHMFDIQTCTPHMIRDDKIKKKQWEFVLVQMVTSLSVCSKTLEPWCS